MAHPNVKQAHIVPRTYLENWAYDERIASRVIGDPEVRIRRVKNVGTRRRYYRRELSDGTSSDDAEASLAKGEDAATATLRTFADRWPLQLEERMQLAELFAYQLVRGPRWKDWHGHFTQQVVEGWLEQEHAKLPTDPERIATAKLLEFGENLVTNTERFRTMFSMAPKVLCVFGSMHWTLVEFAAPVVATSDHPVVVWPADIRSRIPEPAPLGAGLLEVLEIRLPLGPRHAVVLTWADHPDDAHCHVRGSRHHAANLNAFTIAEADKEWFHVPETKPPVASGRLLPLSPELVLGYGVPAATHSNRRAAVSEFLQGRLGVDLDEGVPVFGITDQR